MISGLGWTGIAWGQISVERLNPRLGASQDQRVDVVRAFIGVDGFQIQHVPDDVVFIGHAIAAMHVARDAGDVERLAAIVALHKRDHFRRSLVLIQ